MNEQSNNIFVHFILFSYSSEMAIGIMKMIHFDILVPIDSAGFFKKFFYLYKFLLQVMLCKIRICNSQHR